MEDLIENLYSRHSLDKIFALKEIQKLVEKNQISSVPNPTKLFKALEICLDLSMSTDIQKHALNIVNSIINDFGPDLEIHFNQLIPKFLSLLHYQENKEDAFLALKSYINLSYNIEYVIGILIKEELQSGSWSIRKEALRNLVVLMDLETDIWSNPNLIAKIIEAVVRLYEDPFQDVSDEALSTSKELLEKITCLEKALKRLSPYIRKSFEKHIGNIPGIPKNNPNLVFGFIPKDLMSKFSIDENWRVKVSAVEELESLVSSISISDDILHHFSDFLVFLSQLLKESNFKVVISALSIVEMLCKKSIICTKEHIDVIVPLCIEKLGDNKIAIRQMASKIMACLLEKVRSFDVFPHLIKDLHNRNWHIREEVVTVIILAMLRMVNYDYLQLIPYLTKLLDDDKTKVRHVSTESLAVLSSICGEQAVIRALEPIIDNMALKSLIERFRYPVLPHLEENAVVFPRIVPSSAPIISSPYITSSPFPNPQDTKDFKIYNNIMNTEEISPLLPPMETSEKVAINDSKKRNSRNSQSSLFSMKIESRPGFLKPPTIPVNMNTRAAGMQFSNNQSKYKTKESQNLMNFLAPTESPTKKSNKSFQDPPVLSTQTDESEQQVYLSEHELEPLADPGNAISICMNTADDWAAQFDTINLLRRLTKHHGEVLGASGMLHHLIIQATNWAYSLRSSLCKNSLILFGEMCEKIPMFIETELKTIVSCLMRKSSDSNSFISDQATDSLISMAKYCNVSKALSAVINFASTSKATLVKSRASLCFQKIFERSKENVSKIKELDRAIQLLATYIYDASSSVRAAAKDALQALGSELDRLLMRCLSEEDYRKAKEQLEKKRGRTPRRILRSAEPGYLQESRTPSQTRSFRVRNSPARDKGNSATPEPSHIEKYAKFGSSRIIR
ncbi:unnamed protein product [Blepharisma stoltei]|uniref:TOG domain-containing protein n=1 Tax=Blepharisma stoltei TaxID=1481888 RepID=A0AAU9JWE6_9CILI|nr:unnamed protein product [Blepharisma stoltei]